MGICQIDYCQLTFKQIVDFNLVMIPIGVEDDDQILDPEYTKHHLDRLPSPSPFYSSKESISIWDCFQPILADTNIWLRKRGMKTIKVKCGKDFDPAGPISLRVEMRGKQKNGMKSSTTCIPKLTIKGDKAKGHVLEMKSAEPQKIHIDLSNDELPPPLKKRSPRRPSHPNVSVATTLLILHQPQTSQQIDPCMFPWTLSLLGKHHSMWIQFRSHQLCLSLQLLLQS